MLGAGPRRAGYDLLVDDGTPTPLFGAQEASLQQAPRAQQQGRVMRVSLPGLTAKQVAEPGQLAPPPQRAPGKSATVGGRVPQPQPTAQARQKDKFVPLPTPLESAETEEPGIVADEAARISVHCLADSFERRKLEAILREEYKDHALHFYSDVVHINLTPSNIPQPPPSPQPGNHRSLLLPPSPSPPTADALLLLADPHLPLHAPPPPPPLLDGLQLEQAGSAQPQEEHPQLMILEPSGQELLPRVLSASPCKSPTAQQLPGSAAGAAGGRDGAGGGVYYQIGQDAYFFEFGVVVIFGLDKQQEAELLKRVLPPSVRIKPYIDCVEMDEFLFSISGVEPPHIKNDVFTINKRQARTHTVRLAIAHALAQSSKLSLYEQQVYALVEATRHLPEQLAATGKPPASTKGLARLIGRVFLLNTQVTLLSSVLDTPSFFGSAPDHLQALYERALEYLEVEARVEVINRRFQVLQEMLDLLRHQQNNFHGMRLELIVVALLVLDTLLMLFQLLSLFGIIGRDN